MGTRVHASPALTEAPFRRPRQFSPAQVLVLSFAALIALGAILLRLPLSAARDPLGVQLHGGPCSRRAGAHRSAIPPPPAVLTSAGAGTQFCGADRPGRDSLASANFCSARSAHVSGCTLHRHVGGLCHRPDRG